MDYRSAMRWISFPLIAISSAAAAQPPAWAPGMPWEPTAPYVTAGQDEPGYRNWYAAAPAHGASVKAFNDYLTAWGVAGIVPTWQLLRTASDWQKCGSPAFEVPPTEDWPNVVQTLRYVRDKVIPAIGPVEPVSAYRNPALNQCAGGAPESAHRYFQAVDLVPLNPVTRSDMMRKLCDVHATTGEPYAVGLGFYVGLRFHVDSRKFRTWGVNDQGGIACESSYELSHSTDIITTPEPAPSIAPPAVPPTVTKPPKT
jgi:hypothetical protein